MNLSAGICPSCNEHLLIKSGIPFLICPLCGENLSAREGIAMLDIVCADSKKLHDNIAQCIKLEDKYGPQLPLQILTVLAKYFPHNEEVSYLIVRMSGYSSLAVKQHLSGFASVKKTASFSEDFLENSLNFRHMCWADLFEKYINNRLVGNAQQRWLEKLREMRESYRPSGRENRSTVFLYLYYLLCGIINLSLVALFIIVSWGILVNVVVAIVILFSEIVLLYFHHKKFGDRLEISEFERALMVCFMCSLVIAMGGVFVGALITI